MIPASLNMMMMGASGNISTFPTFVNAGAGKANQGATFTVTLPASMSVGDLMVLYYVGSNGPAISGWTLRKSQLGGGSTYHNIYTRTYQSGDTSPSIPTGLGGQIIAVRNCEGVGNAQYFYSIVTDGSITASVSSFSTTKEKSLVFLMSAGTGISVSTGFPTPTNSGGLTSFAQVQENNSLAAGGIGYDSNQVSYGQKDAIGTTGTFNYSAVSSQAGEAITVACCAFELKGI